MSYCERYARGMELCSVQCDECAMRPSESEQQACKVCGKTPPFPGGTRCQRLDCGLINWTREQASIAVSSPSEKDERESGFNACCFKGRCLKDSQELARWKDRCEKAEAGEAEEIEKRLAVSATQRIFAELILGEVEMRGEAADDLILLSIKTLCEQELEK